MQKNSIIIRKSKERCNVCGEKSVVEIFEKGFECEKISLCRNCSWNLIDAIMEICGERKE